MGRVSTICSFRAVMYDRLGLVDEDNVETSARQDACRSKPFNVRDRIEDLDKETPSLPCTDTKPEERILVCERPNPIMKVGSLYKDMKEFRLAMRQYAINNKFELGIESSAPLDIEVTVKVVIALGKLMQELKFLVVLLSL
jgi:hypothetical protein